MERSLTGPLCGEGGSRGDEVVVDGEREELLGGAHPLLEGLMVQEGLSSQFRVQVQGSGFRV